MFKEREFYQDRPGFVKGVLTLGMILFWILTTPKDFLKTIMRNARDVFIRPVPSGWEKGS